jgi:murein endopeptidase
MRSRALYILSGVLALAWATPARADCPFATPVELAAKGDGWHIPSTWSQRGLTYGTASMVGLIQRAAKNVAKSQPGSVLYVGDLSRREGGASEWHKSHRCGCDVDLLFYAVDAKGRQIAPPKTMVPFNARGVGTIGSHVVKFDTARNWALVKALLLDRVRVERLFIHAALKRKLLAFARKRKEATALIAMADARMSQPRGVGAHDDHLHVRIVPTRKDELAAKAAAKASLKQKRTGPVVVRKVVPAKRAAKPKSRPSVMCDTLRR